MDESHPECRGTPGSPVAGKRLDRTAAEIQTGGFQGRQLIKSRADQHDRSEIGRREVHVHSGDKPVFRQYPLNEGRSRAEPRPYPEISKEEFKRTPGTTAPVKRCEEKNDG